MNLAKGTNQKLKLIYLMRIMLEETDEEHRLTMPEIISELYKYDISAERKSVYNDIEALKYYGIDIQSEKKNNTYSYYVASRQFELAELKLLVDSVQSAKFITEKKSMELIKKIEELGSKYDASKLQRQVFVTERVKTMNESIYYSVDAIHTAIAENSKIKFQYFQWNVNKEMELKRDGEYYNVSPWALSWDDENYYLIGFDSRDKKIKHYRVDKMLHIETVKEKRDGKDRFKEFNMAVYAKRMFGMFGGVEETVRLECHNSMAGVIIDRFGKDIPIIKKDSEHFTVSVKVAVSMQFIAWIIGLGEKVKITGPDNIVDKVNKEIERLIRQYKN